MRNCLQRRLVKCNFNAFSLIFPHHDRRRGPAHHLASVQFCHSPWCQPPPRECVQTPLHRRKWRRRADALPCARQFGPVPVAPRPPTPLPLTPRNPSLQTPRHPHRRPRSPHSLPRHPRRRCRGRHRRPPPRPSSSLPRAVAQTRPLPRRNRFHRWRRGRLAHQGLNPAWPCPSCAVLCCAPSCPAPLLAAQRRYGRSAHVRQRDPWASAPTASQPQACRATR
mmetsp:Transcript_25679/g.78032  ORF Transcript_25679/g.78032 Transcript_25679/m.78032 type:complete len:223 (-) Transcript_25679:1418-2086(-)